MANSSTFALKSHFIENTLINLCEDSNHIFFVGDNYFQPGFTLMFTLGFLVYYIMVIRLRNLILSCWPPTLGDIANDLVVSLSMLSFNEQKSLILSLSFGIPSIKHAFPEENLVRAAQHIAEQQIKDGSLFVKTNGDRTISQGRFVFFLTYRIIINLILSHLHPPP